MKTNRLLHAMVWVLGVIVVVPGALAGPTTANWKVDAEATGTNNGLSWTNAFTDLQDALGAARVSPDCTQLTPCEIWVANGTYKPTECDPCGDTERAKTFSLVNWVKVFGGFSGAPDPAHNVDLYETILSGDLLGNDGENWTNRGDNSLHVVTVPFGTSDGARLDGFTIRDGDNVGGADYGGGVFVAGGAADIYNCTIKKNKAGVGGGVGLASTSNDETFKTRIVNCLIEGNKAEFAGGGVGMKHTLNLEIVNCVIVGNKATDYGAGVQFNGGGRDSPEGHMGLIVNTLIAGNELTADSYTPFGAGVHVESLAFMDIVNSTIVQNYALTGGSGGGLSIVGGFVNVYNSTLWANSVATDPQIHKNYSATLTVSYSNVQGGAPWAGTGNINADPQFVDMTNPPAQWALNDYRLSSANSPCVDAGLNAFVPPDEWDVDDDGDTSEPTPDLDLAPRIVATRLTYSISQSLKRPLQARSLCDSTHRHGLAVPCMQHSGRRPEHRCGRRL